MSESAIEAVLAEALTPEQRAAATDGGREILTLACAGSGKSRTLGYRIAWLLANGADARSIVAFTFTEKAADAIKLRVSGALRRAGMDEMLLGAMFIGTIHSYCQQQLAALEPRYQQYEVLDENRFLLYLISRYPELGISRFRGRVGGSYFGAIKGVADAWSLIHDEMLPVDSVGETDPELGDTLLRLHESLDRNQYIDFALMIRLVVDALATGQTLPRPVQHLLVDEYQDVNPAQERLIELLHESGSTLFVVGDDDQSIYGWRGADVNNILSFANRNPNSATHFLNTNFRSTRSIVDSARGFIEQELGPARLDKDPRAHEDISPRDLRRLFFADREEEAEWVVRQVQALLDTRYVDEGGQSRGLTPSDFAVLMRSTRSTEGDGTPRHRQFTERLKLAGIPYVLEAGGSIFERPQVTALRSLFELLRNGTPSREAFLRVYEAEVVTAYPDGDAAAVATVLARWARSIHVPAGAPRRRVYPQELVHELLAVLGITRGWFDDGTLADIGAFSHIIQDVEAVYMSVDSAQRFGEVLNFLSNLGDSYDSETKEIEARPNAVTVMTVHKAKGLEFPVVFVVDLEAGRFPGTRRRYDGILPDQVVTPLVSRGLHCTSREGEARLFYTAVTRAERYLYLTATERLPGGKQRRKPSEFFLRMNDGELTEDPGLLEGLPQDVPRRRVDESLLPTSYSEIRYYLRCPKDYQFRYIYGFSPTIPELFGFGQTVHTAIRQLHADYATSVPTGDEVSAAVSSTFHLKHVPQSGDPINNPGPYERARDSVNSMVTNYVASYPADFSCLRDVEVPFQIPVRNAVLSGTVDLMLKVDAGHNVLEATVIDFKSMTERDRADSAGLDWTELSMQVQLYATAAKDILGENATTGAVHFLKDDNRIVVPIDDDAIDAARRTLEWAVEAILRQDFPMRPEEHKCANCDFRRLCRQEAEAFSERTVPPDVVTPFGPRAVAAFREFTQEEADAR